MFRTQETLENGCKEIDECVASFEDVGIQDRSMVWNTDLCETIELENLLTNAAVTMHSAEARKVCFCFALLPVPAVQYESVLAHDTPDGHASPRTVQRCCMP